jgi:hypothetical protein
MCFVWICEAGFGLPAGLLTRALGLGYRKDRAIRETQAILGLTVEPKMLRVTA